MKVFKPKSKTKSKSLKYWSSDQYEKSVAEVLICEILNKNQVNYLREVSFDKCRNPETGNCFRFDFYIPNSNIIIEYDGKHHEQEIFKKRDRLKNHFCQNNGILLVRFNKTDYYKLNKKIFSFLKKYRVLKKTSNPNTSKKKVKRPHTPKYIDYRGFALTQREMNFINSFTDGVFKGHSRSLPKTLKKIVHKFLRNKLISYKQGVGYILNH